MSAYPLPVIPSSSATVSVSIIDSSARLRKVPINVFFEPDLPGFTTFDGVANVFLITHVHPNTHKTRRVLFDLGMRKDWTNLPPSIVERVKDWKCDIQITHNVSEILMSHGLEPSSIEAIIWSHAHFDHTGDPFTFPPNVDLIVGPGIKSAHMPGYPTDSKSPVLETAFSGRSVQELSFETGNLVIGSMKAIDFFGDGSFYLLDAPGHSIGHINALARTTVAGGTDAAKETPDKEDTFILMTGDAFHHPGGLRPNFHTPLPASFPQPSSTTNPITPASLLSLHPTFAANKPLFRPSRDDCVSNKATLSPEEADDTIAKIQAFDAKDNVFVIAAHDTSLQEIVGHFQDGVDANDWKEKGWKGQGRWAWVGDLAEAVREKGLESESGKEVA